MVIHSLGLDMPKEFPAAEYERIHSRVDALHAIDGDIDWYQFLEFGTAWAALAYRFLACREHDLAFTELMKNHGVDPKQPERYSQERHLAEFSFSGQSAIESMCYAFHAIGFFLKSKEFPMQTHEHRSAINPEKVTKRFESQFANCDLTRLLRKMVDSQEYSEWIERRNVLIHRASPGRNLERSPGSGTTGKWQMGDVIDSRTTSSRRQWLVDSVRELLKAADRFTRQELT